VCCQPGDGLFRMVAKHSTGTRARGSGHTQTSACNSRGKQAHVREGCGEKVLVREVGDDDDDDADAMRLRGPRSSIRSGRSTEVSHGTPSYGIMGTTMEEDPHRRQRNPLTQDGQALQPAHQ